MSAQHVETLKTILQTAKNNARQSLVTPGAIERSDAAIAALQWALDQATENQKMRGCPMIFCPFEEENHKLRQRLTDAEARIQAALKIIDTTPKSDNCFKLGLIIALRHSAPETETGP